METPYPPSVNFHFCLACDMRCRYCFSRFPQRGRRKARLLPADDARAVVQDLSRAFSKLTLVGGEPTLAPHLVPMLRAAKEQGAATMLITNGARLAHDRRLLDRLAPHTDWIGLSVDSAFKATHERLGRAVNGAGLDPESYLRLAAAIRERGIHLKVNTVVTRLNVEEDLATFVAAMAPERWKVL